MVVVSNRKEKEKQASRLSAIGLAHLSLARKQVLGLHAADAAVGLAHSRLLVEKLALRLLRHVAHLGGHGRVAHARLVTRHTRAAAHAALRVLARPLHRLVRLAARHAAVVVGLLLFKL